MFFDQIKNENAKSYDSAIGYSEYANNSLDINYKHPFAVSDKITEIKLKKYLKKSNPSSIFSAGCGDGIWELRTIKMLPNTFIIGYDISSNLISVATDQAKKLGVENNIYFEVKDIMKLDLQPKSIDFITSFYDPLNHIPNIQEVLKEFYEILKPGGKILVSVHSQNDRTFYVTDRKNIKNYNENNNVLTFTTKDGRYFKLYDRRYTSNELALEFKRAGFDILEVFGIDLFSRDLLKKVSPYIRTQLVEKLLYLELELSKNPHLWDNSIHIGLAAQKP